MPVMVINQLSWYFRQSAVSFTFASIVSRSLYVPVLFWKNIILLFTLILPSPVYFCILAQKGDTALIWGAHGGHTESVRVLLDRGADAEVKNTVRAII